MRACVVGNVFCFESRVFTSFSGASFGEMLVTPRKLSGFLAAKAIVLVTTDIPTL